MLEVTTIDVSAVEVEDFYTFRQCDRGAAHSDAPGLFFDFGDGTRASAMFLCETVEIDRSLR